MKKSETLLQKSIKLMKILVKTKNAKDSSPIIYNKDPLIESLCGSPKSRTLVASEFGVDVRTMKRWLKNKGYELPSGLICPNDLRLIYFLLGVPVIGTKMKKDGEFQKNIC